MHSTSAPAPQDGEHPLFLPLLDFPAETAVAAGGRRRGSPQRPPEDGAERKSRRINKYVLAGALLASTNSVLLGYDIGVMSGAILYIKEYMKITTAQEEILIGSLNVFSLIGALAAGKISDAIGRRYTIVIAAATFLIGAILMALALSFPFLIAGRVIAGVGVGFSLTIAPVYVAELSPALARGFLNSLPEIFINAGILLGYISNYAFASLPERFNWRMMLGIAAFPAIAVVFGFSAMPESPHWLAMKGRGTEARQTLMKISESEEEAEIRFREIVKTEDKQTLMNNPVSKEEAEIRFREILKTEAEQTLKNISESKEEAEIRFREMQKTEAEHTLMNISESKEEAENRFRELQKSTSSSGKGVWKELFLSPSRPVRRILIAAIGVNFFMQASGNDAVVYYSPEVFRSAGINNTRSLVGVTVIMGIVKMGFVLISALFLDRVGRRPLLLLGSAGMAFSLAGLGLGSKFLEHSDTKPVWAIGLCVVAVCAALSFFSIGLGPITWVYSSEIFPSRLRAQGSSLAISVNRLVSGAVAMSFLTVSRKITFGGAFFGLAGVMAVATAFFYYFLPETKGKSLEEMETLFEDELQ